MSKDFIAGVITVRVVATENFAGRYSSLFSLSHLPPILGIICQTTIWFSEEARRKTLGRAATSRKRETVLIFNPLLIFSFCH